MHTPPETFSAGAAKGFPRCERDTAAEVSVPLSGKMVYKVFHGHSEAMPNQARKLGPQRIAAIPPRARNGPSGMASLRFALPVTRSSTAQNPPRRKPK